MAPSLFVSILSFFVEPGAAQRIQSWSNPGAFVIATKINLVQKGMSTEQVENILNLRRAKALVECANSPVSYFSKYDLGWYHLSIYFKKPSESETSLTGVKVQLFPRKAIR